MNVDSLVYWILTMTPLMSILLSHKINTPWFSPDYDLMSVLCMLIRLQKNIILVRLRCRWKKKQKISKQQRWSSDLLLAVAKHLYIYTFQLWFSIIPFLIFIWLEKSSNAFLIKQESKKTCWHEKVVLDGHNTSHQTMKWVLSSYRKNRSALTSFVQPNR